MIKINDFLFFVFYFLSDWMFVSYRYTLMLMYTISVIIHGVTNLIPQKTWQIHIWEWQQMGDTCTLSRDNMVLNAGQP